MKNDVSYLPQDKQRELELIVGRIRAFIEPAMIILFGSYARGDYREEVDLEPDRKSGHASDYDILVVTPDKSAANNSRLWKNIIDSCDKLNLSAHPKMISHQVKFVNEKLTKGQYFFCDIVKEGILLFDAGTHTLAPQKPLTSQEQKQVMQDYFDQFFTQAKDFYRQFEHAIEDSSYKMAAFDLNQTAESCYKTILLVFISYCPNEHHLNVLSKKCIESGIDLGDIFLMETEQQRNLFELLDYAYIGARYDKDYKVTKEQIEYLAERIKKLLDLTETICKEKIQTYS